MRVQDVQQQLDELVRSHRYNEIESLLLGSLGEAFATRDQAAALSLLNELMGYYRGMSRLDEALSVARRALGLLDELGLRGSAHHATTLLNVATAHRAAGQLDEAVRQFEEVQALYRQSGVTDPYLIASLYNNLSLAHQEAGRHEAAIACLEQAMPRVQSLPQAAVEVAVTHTNLALSKMRCGRQLEAREHLLEAVRLFEAQAVRNSHYSAALAGLGEIAFRARDLPGAVAWYEKALREIDFHYGHNLYYAVTLESLGVVLEDLDPARAERVKREAQALQAGLRGASLAA